MRLIMVLHIVLNNLPIQKCRVFYSNVKTRLLNIVRFFGPCLFKHCDFKLVESGEIGVYILSFCITVLDAKRIFWKNHYVMTSEPKTSKVRKSTPTLLFHRTFCVFAFYWFIESNLWTKKQKLISAQKVCKICSLMATLKNAFRRWSIVMVINKS